MAKLSSYSGYLSLLNLFLLAVLGFHCCAGFSVVATCEAHSLVAMLRLLIVVASLVAEHRLQGMDLVVAAPTLKQELSNCDAWV